jgi:predicted TIM-barrel fold metal-dependent hydrolase
MTGPQEASSSTNTAMLDYKLVDARVHIPLTKEEVHKRDQRMSRTFDPAKSPFFQGRTMEEMISEMDDADVEMGVLVTAPGRDLTEGRGLGPIATSHGYEDEGFDELCQEVADVCKDYPNRFRGMAMIDPMGGMAAVRQLTRSVEDFGFIACAIMPSLIGVPPDHAIYYPIYTRCIELGIPITINMGMPGPHRRALTQSPAGLDEVLLTYPELKLVGSHVGFPWHNEVVALLQKHTNFFLMTSAWSPKYVPQEIFQYMNSRGRDKVMWATTYPLLPFDKPARDAQELELKPEVMRGYLRDNAIRVFGLDL